MAQPPSPDRSSVIPTQSISRAVWLAVREAVTGRRYRATESLPFGPAQAARPAAHAPTAHPYHPAGQAEAGPGE